MALAGASRCVASAPSQHHTFHGLLAADTAPSTEAVKWIILYTHYASTRPDTLCTKLNLETTVNMLQSGVIPFPVSTRATEQGDSCLLV